MEVINDVFNPRDAELIERIPLSMHDRRDSWFWWLDEEGMFTVKSCYRWLQGDFDNVHNWFWNKLWAMKLPGKVIHFIWKVCKGCLPNAKALTIKKVVETGQCPWCRNEIETDTHVLFTCDFARSVWYSAGLQQNVQVLTHETSFMVFLRVFEKCTKEQCALVTMISWSIWNRRNKWLWDKINGSAFGVKAAAMHLLAYWKEAHASICKKDGRGDTGDYIWKKRIEGWIKVNTDVAVFNNGSIGSGCVLRDDHGGSLVLGVAGYLEYGPREKQKLGE